MRDDIQRLSAIKLRRLIQREVNRLPLEQRATALQNVDNAILAQFIHGIGVLKGGGSLSLRYPLSKGRTSRDLDATVRDSIQEFRDILSARLEQGMSGFTGTVVMQTRKDSAGMKAGMVPFDIQLFYNGGPFASYELEATPDHSGFLPQAAPAISEQTASILKSVGIPFRAPDMIAPIDQLADKLHAISKPGSARGRDLADIMTLTGEVDLSDLDELRAIVRRIEISETAFPHAVRVLEADTSRLNAFREAFKRSNTAYDFQACWDNTQRLLRQVDERHRSEWEKSWCHLA
ncbi:nucleotidyl transferase AbiEii/AbiGii toxin family protein [Bifidobacterium samirii]|uniref:Nucleotidyl transferase PF08843 family n=1 Tax=Bifidobacterium samirii TaxID=2306974 RepID=A0A430FU35_9BIFI|nr:nucleotidyl transferase AbiEii/AbiGii toxin family protein [Bifidobacterium samirii]RSX56372.1 nucleotidyl transferase PF08843 family [Bifidobacterium samirii]